jgi:hypothetical protein
MLFAGIFIIFPSGLKTLTETNERIVDYESRLEEIEFRFPDLIDSYYANLVNAGYFQINSVLFGTQLRLN